METYKNNEKILLIGDFLASGDIGGSLCKDILKFYSYDTDFIPTALISNKFSLKPIEIFDSSDFLENTLKVYKKQNRKYKAVFVGFVNSFKQAKIICDFIKEKNLFFILDPIMGDEGEIYKSLDSSVIKIYKYMSKYADIIIPNLTEANLLTDKKFDNPYDIIDYYKTLNKNLIITSVDKNKRYFILAKDGNYIEEDYEYLGKSIGGSGDLFDSIFLVNFFKGYDLKSSIKKTRDMVSEILFTQVELDKDTSDLNLRQILQSYRK